jgi:hypothetical protein
MVTYQRPVLTPAEEADRYMRLAELAQYSSLSVQTLKKLIAAPVHPLPAHRPLPRVLLVQKSEFDRWVREREDRAAAVQAESRTEMSFARRVALESRGYPVRRD